MNYTTKTEKCYVNGWNSETLIDLEPCQDQYGQPATRILQFTTSKGSRGLSECFEDVA